MKVALKQVNHEQTSLGDYLFSYRGSWHIIQVHGKSYRFIGYPIGSCDILLVHDLSYKFMEYPIDSLDILLVP